MKENSSSAGKNQKHKRRNVPCGVNISICKKGKSVASESTTSVSSSKQRLKGEINDHSSSKKIRDDGSYDECDICDLGGNLLCCDGCPRTYHLQCLFPPLVHVPTGKWQCPYCCHKFDPNGPLNHLDLISKWMTPNISTGKSDIAITSAGDKVSQISESSIPGRKRPTSIRKCSKTNAQSARMEAR